MKYSKNGIAVFMALFFFFAFTSCGKKETLAEKARKGDQEAITALLKKVQEDPESANRAEAAKSLVGVSSEKVREVLLKQYSIDDDTVRPAILEALYYNPNEKIFPMMKKTYYSSKTSTAEKAVCIRGFARSGIKAAHDIVKAAAWGKKVKKYFDEPSEHNYVYGVDLFEDEEGPYIYLYADPAIQNEAIKSIAEFKLKSAEKTIQGVLLNERFKENETGILCVKALARLNSAGSFYYIKKFFKVKVQHDFDTWEQTDRLVTPEEIKKTAEALSFFTDQKLKGQAGALIAHLYYRATKQIGDKNIKPEYENLLKKLNPESAYVISTTVLNIRTEPTARGKKIGACKEGDAFLITDRGKIKQQIDDLNDYWYQIQFTSKVKGWVYGGYLLKLSASGKEQ